jgi:hypothetical protein
MSSSIRIVRTKLVFVFLFELVSDSDLRVLLSNFVFVGLLLSQKLFLFVTVFNKFWKILGVLIWYIAKLYPSK